MKNIPTQFDYGKVVNNVYSNNYFNFNFDIDPNWTVLNSEEVNRITNAGLELASGDDKNFERMLDASQINVAPLLYSFKYPLEKSNVFDFNASIVMNAENIKGFPNITDVNQYLEKSVGLIEQSAMDVEIVDALGKRTINDKEYGYISMINRSVGLEITQEYFAVIENNFVVNIVISYTSDDDKAALHKMINSLRFNRKKGGS